MSGIEVPIELRWGDQDAYGHVNNVAIMRLLEEARGRAFWRSADQPDHPGIFPPLEAGQPVWAVVADFTIKYRRQLDYQREPVIVEMTIPRIGGASFVIDYALRTSRAETAPRVTASSTLALIDSATGRPQRIDAQTRSLMQRWSPEDSG